MNLCPNGLLIGHAKLDFACQRLWNCTGQMNDEGHELAVGAPMNLEADLICHPGIFAPCIYDMLTAGGIRKDMARVWFFMAIFAASRKLEVV